MKELSEKKALKGFKNLKHYLKYFGRYRWLCFGFWFGLIATGVISFFQPLAIGKVVTFITVDQNFDLAIKYAIIFAILEFTWILFSFMRVPFFKKLENYVKRDVKLEIIKDSYNINIGEYEKLGNGAFITRLTSDLDSLANSFKSISEAVVNLMSKIGFVVFVFVINYWIGFFLLAFILLRYFVYQIRMHYFAKMKPKVLRKTEDINSLIGESIRGVKDIKTLGLSDNLVGRVRNLQSEYMKLDNKEWYVGTALVSTANFVSVICNLLFIVICVFLISTGRLDLAIFYSIYVYKNSVMDFAGLHVAQIFCILVFVISIICFLFLNKKRPC